MYFDRRLVCFFSLALALVGIGGVHAQQSILSRNYDAKTFIKIDSMFGESVKSGFRPYLVTIRNGKSRPIIVTSGKEAFFNT